MRRVGLVALAGLACLVLSAALGAGTAPLGRVLLSLGLPGLAAPMMGSDTWRGVALYRAGDWDGAAAAFGAEGGLNLGNALTRGGHYAAALEAFDVARAAGDARAEANFDLVAAYYAGLALDPDIPIAWSTRRDLEGAIVKAEVAQGSARAAGEGDASTNTGALLGLPELVSHAQRASRRVFDDKFMVADRRWLRTLEDVPGAYLGERIAFERKARAKAGLAPPEPEDPS